MKATRRLAALSIFVPFLLVLASPAVAIPLDWYDYIIHDPIEIEDNDDFVGASGVTGGSGTPDDPYLISTWDILPPPSMEIPTAIRISNTTVSVLIEYVHVQHARYGILLQNVTNVTVRSCLITHNEFGVSFEQCSSCEILNSSLAFNERAIRVLQSTNLVIWDNDYEDNSAVIVYSEPATIVWWVVISVVLLGGILAVLLYTMRRNFSARRKPAFRIGARLAAIGLILLLDFYQIAPYLERSFGNGAVSWHYYVILTGIVVLFSVIFTVFAIIYRTKWIEPKLP